MARPISRAAGILGYSGADWMEFSSQEKRMLRGEARNAERRVARYANRSPEDRKGDRRPEDWETWEWELYREAMGL